MRPRCQGGLRRNKARKSWRHDGLPAVDDDRLTGRTGAAFAGALAGPARMIAIANAGEERYVLYLFFDIL